MSEDVLVIGAGVIGLAIADLLSREGRTVRVLDGQGIGTGASGAAAGMLAPISEAKQAGPLFRLGLESLSRFEGVCGRLKEETGIDPELEPSGLLRLVTTEAARELIGERRRGLSAATASTGTRGRLSEWLDRSSLRDVLSDVSPSVIGAFYSPLECHLRPPLLVTALATAAKARGVAFETSLGALGLRLEAKGGDRTRILGVETSSGFRAAGQVVVAAGAWTTGLLGSAGIRLGAASVDAADTPDAITPVRGQILSLEAPLPKSSSIVWGDGIYFVPKRDGSWIVGATEEHVGFDSRVTAEGIATLLERAREVFPQIDQATFGRAWAGLRPVSRDGLPWLGGIPGTDDLFVAAGHGRNGVLLSPVTAERVCDEMLGKRDEQTKDVFAASRGSVA